MAERELGCLAAWLLGAAPSPEATVHGGAALVCPVTRCKPLLIARLLRGGWPLHSPHGQAPPQWRQLLVGDMLASLLASHTGDDSDTCCNDTTTEFAGAVFHSVEWAWVPAQRC